MHLAGLASYCVSPFLLHQENKKPAKGRQDPGEDPHSRKKEEEKWQFLKEPVWQL